MTRVRRMLLPLLLMVPVPAATGEVAPFPPAALAEASMLRERSLLDDTAYGLLRSLTTEVGPRPAGSAGDGRAVAWALERFRELGFQHVHAESVRVQHWVRGETRAAIASPWPQPLAAVALGGSVATPPEGIEAEVLAVTSVAELQALPPAQVQGRIVFYTGRLERSHSVAAYDRVNPIRSRGAAEAARRGAVAVVIRSVSTAPSRLPHTGAQRYEAGEARIPALALSNPDADLVAREMASGRPVRLRLNDSSRFADSTWSANVIGEIPGAGAPQELVVLGAHLDSWDLGTGAQDDGAGVATVTAAARLAGAATPRPRRTLRVVLFANEEMGISGARAYARAHAADSSRTVLGMESDLGAYPVTGLASRVPTAVLPRVLAMQALLEPLGVAFDGNDATGDADVGQIRAQGVPVLDVHTDAWEYFDLHHSADDTFDKVDPRLLRQNVACYATLAYLAAQAKDDFGRATRDAAPGPGRGR